MRTGVFNVTKLKAGNVIYYYTSHLTDLGSELLLDDESQKLYGIPISFHSLLSDLVDITCHQSSHNLVYSFEIKSHFRSFLSVTFTYLYLIVIVILFRVVCNLNYFQ
uniref:Uncharacterized protein n=1 Tax=Cacopsylla melanoneura TaxID=428564 RepID=A0A8D8S387_9HEMI